MTSAPDKHDSLYQPPDGQPRYPPTLTRAQALPFSKLTWENFERLCHRLASAGGAVEHAARYGRTGQAQAGIDIYARLSDGSYHCWQAKRRASFTAANLRNAITHFMGDAWAARSTGLTIALQANLADTGLQDEIERQHVSLESSGIVLHVLGEEQLTDLLRNHPQLIDDFFGREWVKALLGPEAAATLGNRLDGASFSELRRQLLAVYDNQFHLIDPGGFVNLQDQTPRSPLTIGERFLTPDILEQQRRAADNPAGPDHMRDRNALNSQLSDGQEPSRASKRRDEILTKRVPLEEWLLQGERTALLGDAGSGKSSLLRCLALDMLGAQTKFSGVARRWGDRLPLFIPFARWAREAARDGAQVGLKEIVRRTLQPLLTADLVAMVDQAVDEHRILLLIDGLDEWANEQAARTALHSLLTFAGAHGASIIMTARPRGFEKIGTVPADWRTATIAPFTQAQQSTLALCWFSRFGGDNPTDLQQAVGRTSRFMAELARDRGMSALAEVPLLLVGLIRLSLRGQILPRSKLDAYDQLISLLLEQHPERRATAAGDVQDRFQHARDPEQRRAALARLAFTIRSEAGDAGYPIADAKTIIRTYLQSPEGFSVSPETAQATAQELLAVNSEVQGLIVEKAPREIGFAHASFEEFLAAEHLQTWPLDRSKEFIITRAGDVRWRNVIVALLAGMTRRNEFEDCVNAIERVSRDPLEAAQAAALLGELAFTAPNRSPATATRLTRAAISMIETGDWPPARQDALNSALGALGDKSFGTKIEEKLRSWSISRSQWRVSIFNELAAWTPREELFDALWRGLHDEDRRSQRAAASAIAQAYGRSDEVGDRLRNGFGQVQRLSVAATMLEALRLGWPSTEGLTNLYSVAAESIDPALALSGIAGLTSQGQRSVGIRDRVLRWTNMSQGADFADQESAQILLLSHWPNDEDLITTALQTLGNGPDRWHWDRDDAAVYLLSCSPEDARVKAWVLGEFGTRYPFNLARRNGLEGLSRFIQADASIRDAAITYWTNSEHRKYHANELLPIIGGLKDDNLKSALLADLVDRKDFEIYWITRCLLGGWGMMDPEVSSAVLAAIDDDDRCINLVSLVPQILTDTGASRRRLLALSGRQDLRQDLFAEGLAAAGCDGSDVEAVEALLQIAGRKHGIYSGNGRIFRHFSVHPDVRALALEDLESTDPSFAGLAAGFEDDTEIGRKVLDAATPLPTELRATIIEAAVSDPTSSAYEELLLNYDRETDAELKVRLSVGHYRYLQQIGRGDREIEKLIKGMKAVGPENRRQRSAALAGLLSLGRVAVVVEELEGTAPVRLAFGDYHEETPSLQDIVCEEWQQLVDAFGNALPERVDSFANGGGIREVLAAAPWRSDAARRTFLETIDDGEEPLSARALKALAQLRPASDQLLQKCLASVKGANHSYADTERCAEVVLILREHFPAREEVAELLMQRFLQSRGTDDALLVGIYAPEQLTMIERRRSIFEIGTETQQWAVVSALSAVVDTAQDFAAVLKASFQRRQSTRWNFQAIPNLGVVQRLREDNEARQSLAEWIRPEESIDLFTNAARHLAMIGHLESQHRAIVTSRLQAILSATTPPVAIYDAASGRIRSATIAMFYALQGEQPVLAP